MTLIQKTDQWGRPDYSEKWDWNVPEIPTFEETESGRRRRGELECLVDYVVKEWLVGPSADEIVDEEYVKDIYQESGFCTTEYIAHRCTELDGHNTSSGAVWKVLTHFKEIGYADINTQPNRFECLTTLGLNKGLKQLEEEHKRARKKEKRDREVRQFNNAQVANKIRRMR